MEISFNVNNGMRLVFEQQEHDGPVFVKHFNPDGSIDTSLAYGEKVIFPGDFVMLNNLFWDIKENDIRNDFINPYGSKKA